MSAFFFQYYAALVYNAVAQLFMISHLGGTNTIKHSWQQRDVEHTAF